MCESSGILFRDVDSDSDLLVGGGQDPAVLTGTPVMPMRCSEKHGLRVFRIV